MSVMPFPTVTSFTAEFPLSLTLGDPPAEWAQLWTWPMTWWMQSWSWWAGFWPGLDASAAALCGGGVARHGTLSGRNGRSVPATQPTVQASAASPSRKRTATSRKPPLVERVDAVAANEPVHGATASVRETGLARSAARSAAAGLAVGPTSAHASKAAGATQASKTTKGRTDRTGRKNGATASGTVATLNRTASANRDHAGVAPEVAPQAAPTPASVAQAAGRRRTAAAVADDLTRIEGIGPKVAQLLADDGITDYATLAEATPAELSALLAEAGPRYRLAQPDTWPEQAALLAAGDEAAFTALTEALRGGVRD